MSNFNPYSNYGWVAYKVETTKGVEVTPDTYLKVTSESFTPSYGIQSINEIAGSRERNIRAIQGQVEMSGEIEFNVDEKRIGDFLNSLCGNPTHQDVFGDGSAYRHVFEIQNDDNTYTFDVRPAGAPWKHRFFGTHVMGLAFARNDNAITVTASMMPTKAFIVARVTTAASSGTTLVVDQVDGLTTSDTILVLDTDDGYTTLKELTISSINTSTKTITVNETIDVSIAVNDLVVLKAETVTESDYSQCSPFQFMNGTAAYDGADIDNTSERTIEDFEITLNNDLEARYGSGDDEASRFPYDINIKGYTAEGSMSFFYDDETNIDRLRANAEFGYRLRMNTLNAVAANSAQKASSTWGTTNGFKIEASTAGRAGNDINVTIVVAADDNLAASKTGNNILISLANTTASKNTGTLIAAAVDALSGVDGTAEGTGAEEFTTAESNVNLGFRGTGTDVVGADASQKGYLQFDFAAARINPYFVSNQEDNVIMEEVPMTFYKDTDCEDAQRKNWSTRIYLYNDVASY